jgi:hypothetical protein
MNSFFVKLTIFFNVASSLFYFRSRKRTWRMTSRLLLAMASLGNALMILFLWKEDRKSVV